MDGAIALRSVDLRVPDLAAARRFYTGAWGLTEVGGDVFRATGADHHVLALHEGPPALVSVTFRAASRAAVDRAGPACVAVGGRILAAPGPVDWPGGGYGVALADPWGRTMRLVHGDETRPPSPPDPTRPTRLSHVNLNSTDPGLTIRFFEGVFGFQLTDRTRIMAFVRCNADHHAIVIADAATDGLNHVAFMMPSWEAVMRGAGRMVDGGHPIAWGPGRHGPGDNVFAYFLDPFGIVIEYTAEVLQVDETYRVGTPVDWTWPPGRTDHWGIGTPKGPAVQHAQTAIGFVPA